ncbi:MAG: hypothetical protein HFF13_05840 [Angelakisella sp.]|jgi:hypothetical protein|nr:hypothetical protein [Angelakisella sp.]
MSNYALQSQLSELQSQLRKAERINAELWSELSTIERGVNRAHKDLEDYNGKIRGTLDSCNGTMRSSHQRVIDAIEVQGEIEKMYVRFKQVELANKKIRAANNKKYYDFANYRTVRKIVQGIMDNLDINIVSDKTITKSVEVQHLQTPDYWLTCVLISVMAWRNNDKELAERAIVRAINLDKKNSAIFYMLYNLRMGREDAALKWFYTYQECELKGSDQRTFLMLFSLVSKTLADNVDDSTKNEIFAFINKVIDSNMKAFGYSKTDIVAQIRQYINRMQPSDQLEYSYLRKFCTEFELMSANMMQAKNNINILEFILRTVNVPIEQKNTFLKGYIDELIATPNQSEKDVYDEIAYNELVIRYEGEIETAKEVFAAEQAKKADDLNLIAEMIDWIYERDSQDVNGQIRLNMFALTKALQEQAVDEHVEDYRSRRKANYWVTIGEYSTEVNFKREDEEYSKVSSYFTDMRDRAIASIKNWKAFIGFGVGVAAAACAFFVEYWLFAVALIGMGYGAGVLISNKSQIKQLEQKCAESIKATNDTLQKLFVEFSKYQTELDEYDSYYERIKNEFNKI